MALASALLGFFLITMDATIVNVALPSIQADLHGGATALQWIVDGYTLPFAGLLLGAGSFTDRIGAKKAFSIGVFGFAIASIACAAAPTMGVLIGARVIQGAFAAAVTPASMALVRHAYDNPTKRAWAVSIWSVGGGVAAICGPLLSGLLTTYNWRLIFTVNIPVAIVILILLKGARPSPIRHVSFDWAGQITALLAIGGLVFAAIEAGSVGVSMGTSSPPVLLSLSIGIFAACAFVILQGRAGDQAMVPLTMFRSRTLIIAVLTGFTFMVGFFGQPFVFSLFLQQQRGLTALQTGLVFLPMMAAGAIFTPVVPKIVDHFGPRLPIIGGQVFMAIALLGLALVPAEVPIWVLSAVMVPVGLTAGFINPPMSAVILNHVESHLAGTVSGVYNTSRQVGGALAIAVFGALLSSEAGLVIGMRASMVISAVLVLSTALAGAGLKVERNI